MATKKTTRKKATSKAADTKDPKPEVRVLPPHCPSCGSTERTQKECMRRRKITGKLPTSGFEYNVVVWSDTSCKKCLQKYRIVEYSKD